MITKTTRQPTPEERRELYNWSKRGYEALNPATENVFGKRFNQEFQSLFGESK